MQFVSTMDQSQQIDEVCQFFIEHLASSVTDAAALKGFNEKLEELQQEEDYVGILKFILSKKACLETLPTTYRTQSLTIQRLVLLILPLFQALDTEEHKSLYQETKTLALAYCDFIEGSSYPLSIKVNS
jgi:hypothetical protein